MLHSCIYVPYMGRCGVGPNALKSIPTREMRNRSQLHGKLAAKLQGRCALQVFSLASEQQSSK